MGKIRLALLISGGGTTASAIIKVANKGILKVDPVLVIASRENIQGIARVKIVGIKPKDIVVINPKLFATSENFGRALITECKKRNIDLVGQYGWLPLTPKNFIRHYRGKIINQHPGPLDPPRADFGGKGMYGRRVHCAVLYFRRVTDHDFWTEATTHFVTEEFDKGEVIKRVKIPILSDDTVESLQARVLPIEHQAQIETLRDFVEDKVKVQIRKTHLIKENEIKILNEAKRVATILYPSG